MNLLIEELKAPHTSRERERGIQHDLLAAARSALDERGCHPFIERVSLLLTSAGARLNAWAAPSHRQVRLELSRESSPVSVA